MTEREWSERLWPFLTRRAAMGLTINYGSAKKRIGFKGWQNTFSSILGRIANHCHKKGWPILTVLVVNKKTRKPGDKIPFVDHFDDELERVRAFRWRKHSAPVAEEFPESACRSRH